MIPETDIIIPVHSALDYVKECVRTLYEHTDSRFRLIIIDDYSDAPTREFLYGSECLGRDPRNLYVRTNRQSWFTRAVNTGLRLVRTERAVIINSDCVVGPGGWLEELYGVWDEFKSINPHRSVGLVGHIGHEDNRRWLEASESNGHGYITGHCWLVSMEAMHAIANARGTPMRFLNEIDQGCIHIASDRVGNWEMNRLGYATLGSLQAAVGHHGFKSWGGDLGKVFSVQLKDVD